MSNERQAILQERLKLNSNRRLNRTVARSLTLAPYHPGHEINEVRAEAAVIDKNNFSPLKSVSRFCARPLLSLGASSSLSTLNINIPSAFGSSLALFSLFLRFSFFCLVCFERAHPRQSRV
jgi:hypothetical protein